MLSGNNGIMEMAKKARDESVVELEKEQIQMEVFSSLNSNGELELVTINTNIKNNISGVTTDDATEFPLTITYTNTGNSYIIDETYNVNKVVIYPLVGATLKSGDYVEYNSKPYIVLYDMDSEYNWIEIVSANPLENVTLGKNDSTTETQTGGNELARAIWSYNNAIFNLNTVAQKYLNTDIADRARCIGSNPANPLNEVGNLSIKEIDDNSNSDYAQLRLIGANKISDTNYSFYWLSSRDKIYYDNPNEGMPLNPQLGLERVNSNGILSNNMAGTLGMLFQIYWIEDYCYDEQDCEGYGYEATAGFRPVIKLKPTTKVVDGDGSSNFPYILQK